MRKLYHSDFSPYARRVLIVLDEKELDHEREKHRFARDFSGLAAINPCLMLPVLQDEDTRLCGSNPHRRLFAGNLSKAANRSCGTTPCPAMTRADRH